MALNCRNLKISRSVLYMKIEKMTLVEILLLQDAIDGQLKKIRRDLVKEQVQVVNDLLTQVAEAVNELECRVADYNDTLHLYEEPIQVSQNIKRLNDKDQFIRIIL